jgi:predicted acetyltransferase
MNVALVRVDADDVRLGRLLQLYIHEWSGLITVTIGADALYAYDDLKLYRDREGRAAYLFVGRPDPAPLGFGLVIREPGCWSVEDFFVLAGARRRGSGMDAARALFATRPGTWTFTVREENPGARSFWRRVAPGAAEKVAVGEDGVSRTRFTFAWPRAGTGAEP